MNILIVMDGVLPHPRIERTIITLQELGHKIFLFSIQYSKSSVVSEKLNLKHFEIKAPKLINKISALSFSIDIYSNYFVENIKNVIKNYNTDLLLVNNIIIARAVLRANTNFNLPTILDVHENYASISRHYPRFNKLISKLLISNKSVNDVQRKIYSKFDKIIFVTKEAAEYSIKYENVLRNKVTVLTNTVHPNLYLNYKVNNHLKNKFKNSFTLLYLGDLGLRRGLKFIILSLSEIVKEYKNIKLVLVGASNEKSILKKMVKNLELEKNVDFEGWKEESLFPSYINASDICLCPLNKNNHHNTTHANKLFQYMAGSRPILASDCNSQKILINKTNSGLIYKENDNNDFMNKFRSLYESKELRKNLGKNGLKAINNEFSWHNQSQKFLKLITSFSNKTKV